MNFDNYGKKYTPYAPAKNKTWEQGREVERKEIALKFSGLDYKLLSDLEKSIACYLIGEGALEKSPWGLLLAK